jgi:hypothetical protein
LLVVIKIFLLLVFLTLTDRLSFDNRDEVLLPVCAKQQYLISESEADAGDAVD